MNWGIIGYGEIAPSFIKGLKACTKAQLKGIASISSWEYLTRKKLYNNLMVFSSYDDLLCRDDIDVVYICTTNNFHFENVAAALEAGKHVLCEKPMTPTLKETAQLFNLAKENGVFLMEGMWSRFLPAYRYAFNLLNDGLIGTPKLLKADFGFLSNWPKNRRLLNPDLFGGTLLDNADYNIFLSQDVFQNYPEQIHAQATFAETGVEHTCSIILKYPNGGIAQLYSSFQCQTQQEAVIYGEKGYIKLQEYWHGTNVFLNTGNKSKSVQYPLRANGFEYEIEAVEKAISHGQLECDIITHRMSKQVAAIIDEVKMIISNNA